MTEINLGQIESIIALHKMLKVELGFPDFYGNNWDTFWDAITGLVKMPDQLVFANWTDFQSKFKRDAAILEDLVVKFNASGLSSQIEFRN